MQSTSCNRKNVEEVVISAPIAKKEHKQLLLCSSNTFNFDFDLFFLVTPYLFSEISFHVRVQGAGGNQ